MVKPLSPSEIAVLSLFKESRLTRVEAVAKQKAMTANSVRCYITRLLKLKFLERDGEQTFSTDGKTVYLKMTDTGKQALKVGATRNELNRKARAAKEVKKYNPLDSIERSPLYSRENYVPEVFEPARKGAMEFMKIKSLGTR